MAAIMFSMERALEGDSMLPGGPLSLGRGADMWHNEK